MNPILTTFLEDYDPFDARSQCLSTLFAIAESLTLAGEYVPSNWEFAPSPLLSLEAPETYLYAEYGTLGLDIWRTLNDDGYDALIQAGETMRIIIDALDTVKD